MPTLFQFPSGGALTIADSDVFYFGQNGTEYQLPFSSIKEMFGNVQAASLSIPTASVLTLNGTPLDIVAAPAAGYAIEVVSAFGKMTYNSVAYATNGKVQLITDKATKPQTETAANGFLFGTVTRNVKFPLSTPTTTTETQIIGAKALQVKVDSGNPTAGNSDIVITVFYRIVAI